MKKTMCMWEFKEYFDEHKPTKVYFLSENQCNYEPHSQFVLSLSFPTMLIFERPNLISLQQKNNILSIRNIECVEVDDESFSVGTIYNVVCMGCSSIHDKITYTLVAS